MAEAESDPEEIIVDCDPENMNENLTEREETSFHSTTSRPHETAGQENETPQNNFSSSESVSSNINISSGNLLEILQTANHGQNFSLEMLAEAARYVLDSDITNEDMGTEENIQSIITMDSRNEDDGCVEIVYEKEELQQKNLQWKREAQLLKDKRFLITVTSQCIALNPNTKANILNQKQVSIQNCNPCFGINGPSCSQSSGDINVSNPIIKGEKKSPDSCLHHSSCRMSVNTINEASSAGENYSCNVDQEFRNNPQLPMPNALQIPIEQTRSITKTNNIQTVTGNLNQSLASSKIPNSGVFVSANRNMLPTFNAIMHNNRNGVGQFTEENSSIPFTNPPINDAHNLQSSSNNSHQRAAIPNHPNFEGGAIVGQRTLPSSNRSTHNNGISCGSSVSTDESSTLSSEKCNQRLFDPKNCNSGGTEPVNRNNFLNIENAMFNNRTDIDPGLPYTAASEIAFQRSLENSTQNLVSIGYSNFGASAVTNRSNFHSLDNSTNGNLYIPSSSSEIVPRPEMEQLSGSPRKDLVITDQNSYESSATKNPNNLVSFKNSTQRVTIYNQNKCGGCFSSSQIIVPSYNRTTQNNYAIRPGSSSVAFTDASIQRYSEKRTQYLHNFANHNFGGSEEVKRRSLPSFEKSTQKKQQDIFKGPSSKVAFQSLSDNSLQRLNIFNYHRLGGYTTTNGNNLPPVDYSTYHNRFEIGHGMTLPPEAEFQPISESSPLNLVNSDRHNLEGSSSKIVNNSVSFDTSTHSQQYENCHVNVERNSNLLHQSSPDVGQKDDYQSFSKNSYQSSNPYNRNTFETTYRNKKNLYDKCTSENPHAIDSGFSVEVPRFSNNSTELFAKSNHSYFGGYNISNRNNFPPFDKSTFNNYCEKISPNDESIPILQSNMSYVVFSGDYKSPIGDGIDSRVKAAGHPVFTLPASPCVICKLLIPHAEYREHFETYHPDVLEAYYRQKNRLYNSNIRGSNHIKYKSNLTGKSQLFSCNRCRLIFGNFHDLRIHKIKHKYESKNRLLAINSGYLNGGQNQYPCNKCNKVYKHKSSLSTHLKSHKDNYRKCHLCKNGFLMKVPSPWLLCNKCEKFLEKFASNSNNQPVTTGENSDFCKRALNGQMNVSHHENGDGQLMKIINRQQVTTENNLDCTKKDLNDQKDSSQQKTGTSDIEKNDALDSNIGHVGIDGDKSSEITVIPENGGLFRENKTEKAIKIVAKHQVITGNNLDCAKKDINGEKDIQIIEEIDTINSYLECVANAKDKNSDFSLIIPENGGLFKENTNVKVVDSTCSQFVKETCMKSQNHIIESINNKQFTHINKKTGTKFTQSNYNSSKPSDNDKNYLESSAAIRKECSSNIRKEIRYTENELTNGSCDTKENNCTPNEMVETDVPEKFNELVIDMQLDNNDNDEVVMTPQTIAQTNYDDAKNHKSQRETSTNLNNSIKNQDGEVTLHSNEPQREVENSCNLNKNKVLDETEDNHELVMDIQENSDNNEHEEAEMLPETIAETNDDTAKNHKSQGETPLNLNNSIKNQDGEVILHSNGPQREAENSCNLIKNKIIDETEDNHELVMDIQESLDSNEHEETEMLPKPIAETNYDDAKSQKSQEETSTNINNSIKNQDGEVTLLSNESQREVENSCNLHKNKAIDETEDNHELVMDIQDSLDNNEHEEAEMLPKTIAETNYDDAKNHKSQGEPPTNLNNSIKNQDVEVILPSNEPQKEVENSCNLHNNKVIEEKEDNHELVMDMQESLENNEHEEAEMFLLQLEGKSLESQSDVADNHNKSPKETPSNSISKIAHQDSEATKHCLEFHKEVGSIPLESIEVRKPLYKICNIVYLDDKKEENRMKNGTKNFAKNCNKSQKKSIKRAYELTKSIISESHTSRKKYIICAESNDVMSKNNDLAIKSTKQQENACGSAYKSTQSRCFCPPIRFKYCEKWKVDHGMGKNSVLDKNCSEILRELRGDSYQSAEGSKFKFDESRKRKIDEAFKNHCFDDAKKQKKSEREISIIASDSEKRNSNNSQAHAIKLRHDTSFKTIRFNNRACVNGINELSSKNNENISKARIPPSRFHCKNCESKFFSMYASIKHIQEHTGPDYFVCNICNHRMRCVRRLLKHVHTVHPLMKK